MKNINIKRIMKSFILLSCSIIYAFLSTCIAQSLHLQDKPLPILDKTKSYPTKKLEFETKETYVPLETSKDLLLGEHCKLRHVSDKKILFADQYRGDIFIFNINGKKHSSFNQKNGLGYTSITFVAYDELRKEVFILDRVKKTVFVFSENGALLRRFKTPQYTHLAEIYDFDSNTLLAFDENVLGSEKPIKPYIFIAKYNGEEIGYVNIEVRRVNPMKIIEDKENNTSRAYTFVHDGIPDNCKFGNDFILSCRSMDTVYLLKQNKTLIPLFSQIPSVHSEHPTSASVGMITDKYLKICIANYDIKEFIKITNAGGTWNPKLKHFILNRETGEFYRDANKGKFTVHKVDTPKSYDYRIMQAMNLINANKKGLLSGELKAIASKLDIGDNPVIRITKNK